MSPIIRPIESEPHFPLHETKISVVLNKTQDIILELLLNFRAIHLTQKELSKNKVNNMSKWEQGCGKRPKGNKLKAPYKDRPSKSILQIRNEKPFHYKNPKESLFYKGKMTRVKTMTRLGGREKKLKMRTDKRKRDDRKRLLNG